MRAPNKKRYLNAIRHIDSAEVSFAELEFGPKATSKILGREVPPGSFTYELPPADIRVLLERTGSDMHFTFYRWKLGRKEKVDEHGVAHYIDGTIKQKSDLKNITYPDLNDVRRRLEGILEEFKNTDIGVIFGINPTPFIVTTAIGYQDYYMALIDRPDFIKEFQKRVNEYVVKEMELGLSYPIDCLKTSLIVSDSNGPMMSEDIMEEFEFPYIKQASDMAHAASLPLAIHADGNNTLLFPKIIELGVDLVHPLEPCGGRQDIYKLKVQYGDRITLHGNIDIAGVLRFGSPEEVEQDVLEHLDRLSPGGGYVCASSHELLDVIPLENFWAMAHTATNYKRHD